MSVHPVYAALASDPYIRALISIKARQLTRRPAFYHADREDLEHDLATYVVQQAGRFDPARGSVRTFIARVVDSCFAMMLRAARAGKRSSGPIRSLEDIVFNDEGRPVQQGDLVTNADSDRRTGKETPDAQDQIERALDLQAAEATLDPELRELYRLRQEGTEQAVADSAGISRRQLRKQMEAMRKHFRMKGFGS